MTAHRAQGRTVDTCHVVATPAMTREAFYVAMTRGRHTNHTYASTGPMIDIEGHQDADAELITPADVLRNVLAREGTERSATEQRQQRFIDAGLPGMRPRLQLPVHQYGVHLSDNKQGRHRQCSYDPSEDQQERTRT